MKMHNTLNFAVLRFINENKIKEYSAEQLCRAIENMGYAVIELEGKNETIILENENENFFIFDNGTVKYAAIPCGLQQEEKCLLLLNAAAKIYVSNNPLLKSTTNDKAFAQKLREVLCDNGAFSHLKRHIFGYVSVFIITLTVICFSAVAVFLEKSLDKEIVFPEIEKTQGFSYDTTADYTQSENVISAFNTVDTADVTMLDFTEDTATYYVTKSGTKYHLEGCSYIKDLSQCTPLKLDELYKYQPCKRCIK